MNARHAAIAGLLLSTFVASCSKTPILARIADEVELKDPSLLGSVHSLVVAAGDVDATVNDLFASNGRIYRRTDGSGDWNKVGLPASDIRCMNLATDGTNVYALFNKTDYVTFHSVQLLDPVAGTWSPVTDASGAVMIGSGSGFIFVFFDDGNGSYSVRRTTGTGDTGLTATVASGLSIPRGSSGVYFATKTAIYNSGGTNVSAAGGPTSDIRAIIAGGGNLYAIAGADVWRYNGAWTQVAHGFGNARSIGYLDAGGKHLVLVGVDDKDGYGEVILDGSGARGAAQKPGSNDQSSITPSSQDQYESSVDDLSVTSIFAVASPAVPAGNSYVLYAGITHYSDGGLWAYYSDTRREWNVE